MCEKPLSACICTLMCVCVRVCVCVYRTALLDKLDSHLLRPLCAWYSTTGYPTLVKADTHTINPNNPHHPLQPTQPTNTAATATIPVSRTRASSPAGAVRSAGAGARPRTAPSARPAGRAAATPATSLLASVRASWPEPVPVVASAQEGGVVGVGGVVKPSKEFVRLQERVRRVLGDGAVLCVDSQADRRLEVAVAAQEVRTHTHIPIHIHVCRCCMWLSQNKSHLCMLVRSTLPLRAHTNTQSHICRARAQLKARCAIPSRSR